jgi:hypothetical protein
VGHRPAVEHERYLTEKYAKKPVIVMNYPKGIKAFYMRLNDDGRTVAAMDVLAPGIGSKYWTAAWPSAASTASTTPGTAICAATTVPHAGFGLGFERTLAYVTGLANGLRFSVSRKQCSVGDRDLSPQPGEALRIGTPETTRCARHDSDPTVQLVHGGFSSFACVLTRYDLLTEYRILVPGLSKNRNPDYRLLRSRVVACSRRFSARWRYRRHRATTRL